MQGDNFQIDWQEEIQKNGRIILYVIQIFFLGQCFANKSSRIKSLLFGSSNFFIETPRIAR